jgi:hypothetical protein
MEKPAKYQRATLTGFLVKGVISKRLFAQALEHNRTESRPHAPPSAK